MGKLKPIDIQKWDSRGVHLVELLVSCLIVLSVLKYRHGLSFINVANQLQIKCDVQDAN